MNNAGKAVLLIKISRTAFTFKNNYKMKNKLLLLLLLNVGIGLVGCKGGQTPQQSGCTVSVKVDIPQYTEAYLMDAGQRVLDTLSIVDKTITIERTDTASMPYVAIIQLVNPADSIDFLSMPVVIEGGKVQVEIGEYVTTQGTALNFRLQEFLNDLQATRDSFKKMDASQLETMKKTFSEFYRQQILTNKDNVLGRYIYDSYGIHLNDADRELVKAQLVNL